MNIERSEEKVFSSASVLYSKGNPQPFVAAVTLLGALVAGTGGLYSSANAALVSQWISAPAVRISSTPSLEHKRLAEEISIPQAIFQLREGLGLKMSEVAAIFGVSRQAVYLWMKGENLKNEYVQRIWQLHLISRRMQLAGVDRPEHFIHRPLSREGGSLYQLLVDGANVDSALGLLEEQFIAEKDLRDKYAAEHHRNSRHRKQDLSSVAELTTPILEEVDG